MLHYAMIEKFVAALRDVDLISTYRNGGGDKNVAWNVCGRVYYTGQFSCIATKSREKLHEKLQSVT